MLPRWFRMTLILLITIFLLYITIPLVAIFWQVDWSIFHQSLTSQLAQQALKLSLSTSLISLVIILIIGIPVAYILARFDFRFKEAIDTIIDIPMVLPPAVAGLALLMAFGRNGLIGQYLYLLGISIPFSTLAVIMAQVFVASPFFIKSARAAFEAVDHRYEQASLTLGKNHLETFIRITLMQAKPGIISGAVMTWARALGEFGATLMFAGNMTGRTQTLPLAVLSAFESDVQVALSLSVILIVVSFAVILIVKYLTRGGIFHAKFFPSKTTR